MSELREWLEHMAGLSGAKLRAAISQCEANLVENVQDLRDALGEGDLIAIFPQTMLRRKIENALNGSTPAPRAQPEPKPTPPPKPTQVEDPPSTGRQLPPGKVYGTFASHKKQHSTFGDSSEVRGSSFDLFESTNLSLSSLSRQWFAKATKDALQHRFDIKVFFDADNLSSITREKLIEGIEQSCKSIELVRV